MKYVNGRDILPSTLLEAIQNYIEGDIVYIPLKSNHKKSWGTNTNSKQLIIERNMNIRRDFSYGKNIDQLADEYCLSISSIKKIVYSK
ncbi:CD3324 family protein [Coprococcus phoceensis]|uniref:CD3324 family protein n=1 Tax=Coprococcus phoceensis TaxID=1870993 RepID=UPI0008DA4D9D|nr:CD3324 family protein [Coprococcus phoceensis]